MRTLTVLLLILVVCAVAFSKDLRKRRSYTGDDSHAAALDALVKAIEDGKIGHNGLLNDDTKNPNRRILWNFPITPWGKRK
ncbi:hypothetical protein CHS0354_023118 [Potamilus streckersoni]|uniref:Uncharacterized protein n=1 Tax=Potamilus streckersoni TaxID=2493646 RepID=A0AAE0VGC4_9BIVA|nr:hypothetical protein CHS0354_023118 [Potamilus streckersoni]